MTVQELNTPADPHGFPPILRRVTIDELEVGQLVVIGDSSSNLLTQPLPPSSWFTSSRIYTVTQKTRAEVQVATFGMLGRELAYGGSGCRRWFYVVREAMEVSRDDPLLRAHAAAQQDLRDALRALQNCLLEQEGAQATYRLTTCLLAMLKDETIWPTWFTQALRPSPDDNRQFMWAAQATDIDQPRRWRKGRISTLLQFLRRTFPRQWEEYQRYEEWPIEEIATVMGEWYRRSFDIAYTLVTGQDLVDTYNETGISSCMTNKPYVWLYAQNPDAVRLMRITCDGKYVARALLWTTDDGQVVMDRIYNSGPSAVKTWLYDHAREQGWIASEEDVVPDACTVTLQHNTGPTFGWPYLDTFCQTFDPRSTPLVLSLYKGSCVLRSTCGLYSGFPEPHNVPIRPTTPAPRADMIFLSYTVGDTVVIGWYDQDVCIRLESVPHWIRLEDCVQTYAGEYLFAPQAVMITDGPYQGQYAAQHDVNLRVAIDRQGRERHAIGLPWSQHDGRFLDPSESVCLYTTDCVSNTNDLVMLWDGIDYALRTDPDIRVVVIEGQEYYYHHTEVVEDIYRALGYTPPKPTWYDQFMHRTPEDYGYTQPRLW